MDAINHSKSRNRTLHSTLDRNKTEISLKDKKTVTKTSVKQNYITTQLVNKNNKAAEFIDYPNRNKLYLSKSPFETQRTQTNCTKRTPIADRSTSKILLNITKNFPNFQTIRKTNLSLIPTVALKGDNPESKINSIILNLRNEINYMDNLIKEYSDILQELKKDSLGPKFSNKNK